MYKISTVNTMTLDGGVDCLDFVNSGYDCERNVITERLHTYDDLLVLTERLRLFDPITLQGLKDQSSGDKKGADNALNAARSVRELLYKLFDGLSSQHSSGKLDRELLIELDNLFIEAMRFNVLDYNDDQLQFSFQAAAAGLMAPIWRFVQSAHELLKNGHQQYIKRCQSCAWLFYDKTKNHRKKWCSMESCGNSQKTKRYYMNRKRREAIEQ